MRPAFPASHSLGPSTRVVTVASVTSDGATAICTDRKGFEVRVPLFWQRAKGAPPVVGESWLLSQDTGQWTFLLFLGTGPAGVMQFTSCDVDIATPGRGLTIAEGSNAKMGTAVLSSGSATVANTSVTAVSRIMLTSQAGGGTPGWLRVSARVPGTSFTITSSSGTDSSTVAWLMVEPG